MFRGGWSISSSEPSTRRGLLRAGLAGAGTLTLGACGFRPLYGRGDTSAGEPDLRAQLRGVRVTVLQERFGQLLRRSLYQRMGQDVGGPDAGEFRYELRVAPALQAEGVAIQRDGTASRVRYIGTVNWLLVRPPPSTQALASGVERSIEAYNIPPSQFFASDTSREFAEQRLAEVLAELTVTRLAVFFRQGGVGLGVPVEQPAAVVPLPGAGLTPVDPTSRGLPPGLDSRVR
jgi:LPS-assembly lipoprotein